MKTATLRPMKTVPLSELSRRSQTTESVLVTARGKILGVFHPLPDPDQSIPIEERRKLYRKTSAHLARQLRARGITEAQIERDIQALGKKSSRFRSGPTIATSRSCLSSRTPPPGFLRFSASDHE